MFRGAVFQHALECSQMVANCVNKLKANSTKGSLILGFVVTLQWERQLHLAPVVIVLERLPLGQPGPLGTRSGNQPSLHLF